MKQIQLTSPKIDRQNCTGCMICEAVCPQHAIGADEAFPVVSDVNLCTFCGKCDDLCPTGAMQVPFVIRWNLTH
jgi:ferredoxin